MNERIQELAEQCHHRYSEHNIDLEKFAELIVRECAKSLWTEECHNSDLALEEFERNSAKIKQHFGVEE
jgi:hypothetical protein